MSGWHILTSEYPPSVGGVSDYTRQVAEALAGTGDDVHVWCPGPSAAPESARVHVHPELGSIRPSDLRRLGDRLASFPAPRRLLVQWVPHGFGYHSMNVWFCVWLFKRSLSGDIVELMVHEAYSDFTRGPVRHLVMAFVQRLMTIVLMQTARRVWISTPTWERRLRACALGRPVSVEWLPICASAPPVAAGGAETVRRQYAADRSPLIGHFGTFGSDVTALLEERLPAIMSHRTKPSVLLIGSGSDSYRRRLIDTHREWADRIHAAGYLPVPQLAEHLAACDLFVQPYPDGISARRTSVMTCLSHMRPVVTTAGHSTEPLWAETGAVALASDPNAFAAAVMRLLEDPESRRTLAERGKTLYLRAFDIRHVVDALKAA